MVKLSGFPHFPTFTVNSSIKIFCDSFFKPHHQIICSGLSNYPGRNGVGKRLETRKRRKQCRRPGFNRQRKHETGCPTGTYQEVQGCHG